MHRFLESHWFTWSTQISHIPMDVDTDKRRDWCNLQVRETGLTSGLTCIFHACCSSQGLVMQDQTGLLTGSLDI